MTSDASKVNAIVHALPNDRYPVFSRALPGELILVAGDFSTQNAYAYTDSAFNMFREHNVATVARGCAILTQFPMQHFKHHNVALIVQVRGEGIISPCLLEAEVHRRKLAELAW